MSDLDATGVRLTANSHKHPAHHFLLSYLFPHELQVMFMDASLRPLLTLILFPIVAALSIGGCDVRYDNSVSYADYRGAGTMSVVVKSAKRVSTWQSVDRIPDGHSGLVGGPSDPGKFYLRGMRAYIDSSDLIGYFYRYEEIQLYAGVNQVNGIGDWSDLEGFYMPDAYSRSVPDNVFYTNHARLRLTLFDPVNGRVKGQFWFTASRFHSDIDTVNVSGSFDLFTSW